MKENCWAANRAPPGRPTAPPRDRPRNPWDPLKNLAKTMGSARDPPCPRGPAGGAAGEVPGPAISCPKTLKNLPSRYAANGGRVGDGAGEILGPGTSSSETLEKHWKMNENCYTVNGGVLVLVNGGVPDTLYNLQSNKRWTSPLLRLICFGIFLDRIISWIQGSAC